MPAGGGGGAAKPVKAANSTHAADLLKAIEQEASTLEKATEALGNEKATKVITAWIECLKGQAHTITTMATFKKPKDSLFLIAKANGYTKDLVQPMLMDRKLDRKV